MLKTVSYGMHGTDNLRENFTLAINLWDNLAEYYYCYVLWNIISDFERIR